MAAQATKKKKEKHTWPPFSRNTLDDTVSPNANVWGPLGFTFKANPTRGQQEAN